jgi:hypothetical protein
MFEVRSGNLAAHDDLEGLQCGGRHPWRTGSNHVKNRREKETYTQARLAGGR